MSTTTLADELSSVFAQECAALGQARLERRRKDSPANRAAVAARRATIDAILDTYLDTRAPWPEPAEAGVSDGGPRASSPTSGHRARQDSREQR